MPTNPSWARQEPKPSQKQQTPVPPQKVNAGTTMNNTSAGKASAPPPSSVSDAQKKVAAAAKQASTPPDFSKGGLVKQTGHAHVHKGEVVLTKADAAHLKRTSAILSKAFKK